MPSGRFRWIVALVLTAAVSACSSQTPPDISATGTSRKAEAPTQHRPATPVKESIPKPPPPAAEPEQIPDEPELEDVVDTPKGKAYRLWFKYRPGDTLYFTIENKLRDSGGVPPLLTYTTSIEDRRFITQQILPPTPEQKNTATLRRLASVSWECDRYDVREVGMKDEHVFDSLRHLYPPKPIRRLGGIPGSTSTFLLNPRTGEPTRVRVQLAAVNGGNGGRGKLSKIAEKVQLSVTNLKDLLDDIGPYYLPSRSVHVGEQWVRTLRESHRTFGTIITKVTCTLDSVREVEGRNIATILIDGEISLKKEPEQQKKEEQNAATTKPARKQPPKKSTKDYRIDKQTCSGKVEFDITRGELLELTLRREREFVADVDSDKTSGLVTEIRQATSHELRVRTSRTAPRHPTIIGGPKPPVESVEPPSLATPPAPKKTAPRNKPRTRRTRSSRRQNRPETTTQPAMIPPTSQPANRPKTKRIRRPHSTTRPSPAKGPSSHTRHPSSKMKSKEDRAEKAKTKRLPKGCRKGLHPTTEGRVSSRPPEPKPPKKTGDTSTGPTSQPTCDSAS